MSSSEPEVVDRFAFIDILAGNIPPSQLAILRNSPFLNDDPPPSPTTPTASDGRHPSPMTPPADDPILICSLPQTQPQPEPEMRPAPAATTEKSPAVEGDKGKRPAKDSNQPLPKKSAGSRRRSRGVVLVSYSDSDDGEIEDQAAAPAARMLPATLRAPKKEGKARDPSGKSCGENPTPALKTPIKKEKVRDPSEKMGPESEKAGSTNPSSTSAPSNENTPPPPTNLLDAIRLLFPPVDPKLGEMDILDICAMKGIHFENPRWHRPGGYGRKPKDPK